MASQASQIIAEINAYMKERGRTNSSWYVGIATDVRTRLFNDHAVDEKQDSWIYRQAVSSDAARAIEKAYLDAGCDGGGGGGDQRTDYVYAYLKSSRTNP